MNMKKEFQRTLFSIFFLGVFFVKMLISAAPLLVEHIDSKAVMAVIMQLEIENNSEKSSPEKAKELSLKEFCTTLPDFTFSNPIKHLSGTPAHIQDDEHVQTFYPAVPTPPPNA